MRQATPYHTFFDFVKGGKKVYFLIRLGTGSYRKLLVVEPRNITQVRMQPSEKRPGARVPGIGRC